MKYQAFHKPGEYPPSPIFESEGLCEEYINEVCVDGHNKQAVCEGCVVEWSIEKVP